MPALIRLYLIQISIGFGVAAIFVGALVALDVGSLRHLLMGDPSGWFALVLLWVLNGLVFAGVQFGIAVMRMASDDDEGQGGRRAPFIDLGRSRDLATVPARDKR